jgi:hypothetical protein
MSDIIYQDLSDDLKNEILSNNLKNENLKLGFYSKVYNIKIDGKNHSYRFHSKVNIKNKKINTVIFNGNIQKHNPFKKNSEIFFYDQELKITMKISKDLFNDEIVNMDLSDEQKELLTEGKDVTLDVSSSFNKIKNNKQVVVSNTSFKKTFVADYSFFLGKNSLFIKEILKPKNGLKLIIS